MTPGVAAGYVTQLQFEFPAAAVSTTPFDRAYETALASVADELESAQLMFATRAPWSAAHVIPVAMSLRYAPESLPTWIGMILHPGQ